MSRTSQPTRLLADVYESALAAMLVTSRTVPQPIAHWARIGRELEMSPRVNHRAISPVLAGTGSYDSHGEQEQAIVREEWVSRMTARRGELHLLSGPNGAGKSSYFRDVLKPPPWPAVYQCRRDRRLAWSEVPAVHSYETGSGGGGLHTVA